MSEALNSARGGRASLLISPECRMLIEGFVGTYRYEEIGETQRYREVPEKNAWSHPMDALLYVVGGVRTVGRDRREEREYRQKRWKNRDQITGY